MTQKDNQGFEWPITTEAEDMLIHEASETAIRHDDEGMQDVTARVSEAALKAAAMAFMAGKEAASATPALTPTPATKYSIRPLTSAEEDLMYDLMMTINERYQPAIAEAKKAFEEAEKAAEGVLSNDAPEQRAVREARDRVADAEVAYDDAMRAASYLVGLRLGFRAGAQHAANLMLNPGARGENLARFLVGTLGNTTQLDSLISNVLESLGEPQVTQEGGAR